MKMNCPPEFQDLIDKANLIPADAMEWKKDVGSLINADWNDPATKRKFRNLVPPELEQAVKYSPTSGGITNTVFELERLASERIALQDIAAASAAISADYKPPFNFREPIAAFAIDNDHLVITSTQAVDLIKQLDIPPSRLRECPVCRDIFFAGRTDSPACSPQHINTHNARMNRLRKLETKIKKGRMTPAQRDKLTSNLKTKMRLYRIFNLPPPKPRKPARKQRRRS
jgi:hypothetical protein